VRQSFRSKKVRAKVSISAQIRTSREVREKSFRARGALDEEKTRHMPSWFFIHERLSFYLALKK